MYTLDKTNSFLGPLKLVISQVDYILIGQSAVFGVVTADTLFELQYFCEVDFEMCFKVVTWIRYTSKRF